MQKTKQDTLRAMAIWVLVLEVKQGHLKWKVTDLAKRAGCSRTLIYQYLGATKAEVLRSALGEFLGWFYGEGQYGLAEGFAANIESTRSFLNKNPEPVIFYQKWRAQKGTDIFKQLCAAETKFRERLAAQYPALNPAQLDLVHALLHGLVTAPFLSPEAARLGAAELQRLLP